MRGLWKGARARRDDGGVPDGTGGVVVSAVVSGNGGGQGRAKDFRRVTDDDEAEIGFLRCFDNNEGDCYFFEAAGKVDQEEANGSVYATIFMIFFGLLSHMIAVILYVSYKTTWSGVCILLAVIFYVIASITFVSQYDDLTDAYRLPEDFDLIYGFYIYITGVVITLLSATTAACKCCMEF